jgi:hypothetical protein
MMSHLARTVRRGASSGAARLQVSQHEPPSPPVRRLDLVLRNGGRLPGATPDEQTADGRVVARGEVDGDVQQPTPLAAGIAQPKTQENPTA